MTKTQLDEKQARIVQLETEYKELCNKRDAIVQPYLPSDGNYYIKLSEILSEEELKEYHQVSAAATEVWNELKELRLDLVIAFGPPDLDNSTVLHVYNDSKICYLEEEKE